MELHFVWQLTQETEDIIDQLGETASDDQKTNYNKASKIAMQWIKNYTEFNFRSLGSYTRKELNDIANNSDAL